MAQSNLNMIVTEDRGKIVFKNNSSAEFDSVDEILHLLNLINMGLLFMPKQITAIEDQKANLDRKIEELQADIDDKQKRKEAIEEFLHGKGLDIEKELERIKSQPRRMANDL